MLVKLVPAQAGNFGVGICAGTIPEVFQVEEVLFSIMQNTGLKNRALCFANEYVLHINLHHILNLF